MSGHCQSSFGGDAGQARSVTRYAGNQADEKNSGGGGGSRGQGKASTITSIGKVGGRESVGGGEKDELSEQFGRTFSVASQDGKSSIMGKGTAAASLTNRASHGRGELYRMTLIRDL